jgi:DnaJ family protein C protein 28
LAAKGKIVASIEDDILKAIEEGKFDHLPGKGKPLRLEQDPHEDPEWRLAFHILKNAGYKLPWMEARQDILFELDACRKALQQAWDLQKQALERGEARVSVEAEWRRAADDFKEKLTQINHRIRDFNLQAPGGRFHLRHLSIDKEIEAVVRDE